MDSNFYDTIVSMEILLKLNDENISESELKEFRYRRAVRAVVFDEDNNIALLHATAKGYYTLPGGGVDSNEEFADAVIRECREEVGCVVNRLSELGRIFEYSKEWGSTNESYGYAAHIVGEKGVPIFNGDEDEDEKNSTVVWLPIAAAVKVLENIPQMKSLYSQYCIRRDLAFLRKAEESIV